MPRVSIRVVLSLLNIELSKMIRQRGALTALVLPTSVAFLLPQASWYFDANPEWGFYVLARTLELSLLAGCYLFLLQASLSMAAERQDKTLRNTLVAPVRRSEVILSRWLALQLTMLLLVAVVLGSSVVSTASHFAFGDIYEEAVEPLAEASELRHLTLVAVGYLICPLMALGSVGFLVSVLSATPATAAGLGLGLCFLLDIGKSILPGNSPLRLYFFNYYLPTLFDRSSFLHGVTGYAEGRGDMLWLDEAPEHTFAVVVPLATVAVCLVAASWFFSRRDCTE